MVKLNIDKNNVLSFSHKLKSTETYKISKGSRYKTISIYKEPVKVIGYANDTDSGKFVLCVDYDEIYKKLVLDDFARVQKKYSLPQAYLFSSKKERKTKQKEKIGNYHLVCLCTLKMKQVYDILCEMRCDYNYTSQPRRNPYKNWVLRLSPKGSRGRPKFLEIIGKKINLNKEVSSAHLSLLSKLYPEIPKINYLKKDKGVKVRIQEYETLNV